MNRVLLAFGWVAVVCSVGACGSDTTHGSGGDAGTEAQGTAGGGAAAGGAAGTHTTAQAGSSSGASAGGTAGKASGGQGGVAQTGGSAGNAAAGKGGAAQAGSGGQGGAANCDPSPAVPPDPGDNVCNSFTPCGGDLTGQWTVGKNCAEPAFHSYSVLCQEGTDTTDLVGTLEFVAGGKYAAAAAFRSRGSVSEACLATYSATCGENPFEDCVPNNNGCQCDHTPPLSQSNPTMTWKATGNVLQLTDGCDVVTYYYCVNGNQLDLRSKSKTGQYFSAHATR